MKWHTWAFVICVYALPLVPLSFINAILNGSDGTDFPVPLWWVWGIATIGAIVLGIVNTILIIKRYRKARKQPEMAKAIHQSALWLKLGLIPFYLLNLFLWVIVFATSMMVLGMLLTVFGIAFSFVLAALGAFLTWLIMACTSAHSFSSLLILRREGVLSTKGCVFASICQFIFVADVIAYCIVRISARKKRHKLRGVGIDDLRKS